MPELATLKNVRIEKIGNEWCAFAPDGRELARSLDKSLLMDYLKDAL